MKQKSVTLQVTVYVNTDDDGKIEDRSCDAWVRTKVSDLIANGRNTSRHDVGIINAFTTTVLQSQRKEQ